MNEPIEPELLRKLETEHQDLRLRLSRLPHRAAPPALLLRLKREYATTPWRARIKSWFAWPVIWKPASVALASVAVVGLWFNHSRVAEDDVIDMRPLVAAHSRYQAESLVPDGDLVGSNFGAQLANYYSNEN